MDDIAREAGVAVGTLYRHFPTKADLVAAVVKDSIEQLAEAMEAALDRVRAGGDPGDVLAELFRAVARRHTEDAAVKEVAYALGSVEPLAVGGAPEFAPESAERRAWTALEQLLTLAVDAGAVRPDLTPLDVLTFVGGLPRGPESEAQRDRYVEIVIAGMRAGMERR